MTDTNTRVDGLPVAGYRPQNMEAVDLVNQNKLDEERILRKMDALKTRNDVDQRWLALARTQIELGFMAMNRSIFRPDRVHPLPEDCVTGTIEWTDAGPVFDKSESAE